VRDDVDGGDVAGDDAQAVGGGEGELKKFVSPESTVGGWEIAKWGGGRRGN